jgi:hypothetical protein
MDQASLEVIKVGTSMKEDNIYIARLKPAKGPPQVKKHLNDVFLKTGVANRVQLMRLFSGSAEIPPSALGTERSSNPLKTKGISQLDDLTGTVRGGSPE